MRGIRVTNKSGGAILPLFAVSVLAILAVAGLGLDSGNLMLENTRLQNALDQAALSGAKTLGDSNFNTVAAQAAAIATLTANANNAGNRGVLQDYVTNQIADVNIEFSNTLLPFSVASVGAATPARYIRLTAQNFEVQNVLIPILGFDQTSILTSAVAGPSPRLNTLCNIAPMMVCGNPDPLAGGGAANLFGYVAGEPVVLKSGPPGGGGDWEIGPGNFQLVRLPGSNGGSDLRLHLAGEYDDCVGLNDVIPTEPGNKVGPVSQGLNTRFGIYQGGQVNIASHPPDVIVTQGDPNRPNGGGNADVFEVDAGGNVTFGNEAIVVIPAAGGNPPDLETAVGDIYDYFEYSDDNAAGNYDNPPSGVGAHFRRTMAIPIGDCSGTVNGQGDVPLLGGLCFHLLQEVDQGGNPEVFGQVLGIESGCGGVGTPGPIPNNEAGPYRIELYKDPARVAS